MISKTCRRVGRVSGERGITRIVFFFQLKRKPILITENGLFKTDIRLPGARRKKRLFEMARMGKS